jgi:hypothetical protein
MTPHKLCILLFGALALVACDRPTVVTVPPAPVAVPGPAGPTGATGATGTQGTTGTQGATGDTGLQHCGDRDAAGVCTGLQLMPAPTTERRMS